MKQKQLRSIQVFASLALVVTGLCLFVSCGKEKGVIASPSYSIANFVGTFVGHSTCNTNDTATLTIFAGTDRTTVSIPAWFGEGECKLITEAKASVSGNTMTIDSAYFQDKCFQDYWIDGVATLSKDSIFFTATLITPLGTQTCYFNGLRVADTSQKL